MPEPTTMQDLFNKSVEGVYLQDGPSIYSPQGENFCAYRADDDTGNCCAIGHLIHDDHYGTHLEGSTMDAPDVNYAVEQSINRDLESTEIDMLINLQEAHDHFLHNPWDKKSFLSLTNAVASEYKLTPYQPTH